MMNSGDGNDSMAMAFGLFLVLRFQIRFASFQSFHFSHIQSAMSAYVTIKLEGCPILASPNIL